MTRKIIKFIRNGHSFSSEPQTEEIAQQIKEALEKEGIVCSVEDYLEGSELLLKELSDTLLQEVFDFDITGYEAEFTPPTFEEDEFLKEIGECNLLERKIFCLMDKKTKEHNDLTEKEFPSDMDSPEYQHIETLQREHAALASLFWALIVKRFSGCNRHVLPGFKMVTIVEKSSLLN